MNCPTDMSAENAAGWVCECDRCGLREIFPQLTLGEALRAMYGSGRWWRVAPMVLQEKDYCSACAVEVRK